MLMVKIQCVPVVEVGLHTCIQAVQLLVVMVGATLLAMEAMRLMIERVTPWQVLEKPPVVEAEAR
ncbi:hypothetical protein CHH28_03840 [Bacterioplanes sanyensis]|uniref:Uncharacterized protein n=1 Tax=Bacterioplanes sanyensis TaxID=1249553 RepID=A0A222FFK9_9GAMM|nr:hypothetical protein CHH28_03840 [Bacterioplanes sanyensis]